MGDETGQIGREPGERRDNRHLRALFDTTFAMVEPFSISRRAGSAYPLSIWLFAWCARIFPN